MELLQAPDWIALRLLYILLASDPSATRLPDVDETIRFYSRCLRPLGTSLTEVFAVLNKEIANDGKTFNAPDVKLTRGMEVTWGRNLDGVIEVTDSSAYSREHLGFKGAA
jgi:hypothetical protein